jgi:aspartyl-tRNA(Asn)/glutamyl-tRNA(Gln) amidotransferase subunit C
MVVVVTKEQVKHLSWLSRIELSDEELAKYTSQIEQVVAYLDKLDSIPLEDVDVIKPKKKFSQLREDDDNNNNDDYKRNTTFEASAAADILGTKYRKDGFVKGPRMV